VRRELGNAGLSEEQLDAALDPACYLGAAPQFVDAALAAYARDGSFAGKDCDRG